MSKRQSEDFPVYVLSDIPVKCIKLLFLRVYRAMGNDEIKSHAVYDPTTQCPNTLVGAETYERP